MAAAAAAVAAAAVAVGAVVGVAVGVGVQVVPPRRMPHTTRPWPPGGGPTVGLAGSPMARWRCRVGGVLSHCRVVQTVACMRRGGGGCGGGASGGACHRRRDSELPVRAPADTQLGVACPAMLLAAPGRLCVRVCTHMCVCVYESCSHTHVYCFTCIYYVVRSRLAVCACGSACCALPHAPVVGGVVPLHGAT